MDNNYQGNQQQSYQQDYQQGYPQQGYQQGYPQQGYQQGYPQGYEQPLATGWSWGSFMLAIPYAIGMYAWMNLLIFIPILNFVWMFVAGFKGRSWSWASGKWASVAEFNAAQRSWDRAGLIMFFVTIAGCVLSFIFSGAIIGILLNAAGY